MELEYGAHLYYGPPLEEGGFFQDSNLPGGRTISDMDYDRIECLFKRVCEEAQPFERLVVTYDEAVRLFSYNKYKLDIIKEKVPIDGTTVVYRCGYAVDLCRGPHIPNTSYVKAFKLVMNSASYWKGDVKKDMMQRVYGMSFPKMSQMEEWSEMRRRAQESDHRVIGKHQELFMFHDDSPGACFFLPRGVVIYHRMEEFIRREYRKRGFCEVITPNVYSVNLWRRSGHWDNYKDCMFPLRFDDQDWALKPMNCPVHCLMFANKPRSYRDLPIRIADFGALHRNELSGALTGLTRVRRFQQDDAHIFCLQEHIESEVLKALDFVDYVYSVFGFKVQFELSTMPEKHLGSLETWEKAEAALRRALVLKHGDNWKVNPGDGAFYGPKIDGHLTDALNRSHQCPTIQLDFQLPQRFDLRVARPDDTFDQPIIIHRAIFGSFERFFAILVEHNAGKWPFWLSPRQCIVMSVSAKSADYASDVQKKIYEAGYECELDVSMHLLKKKIRDAQVSQFNFIAVVGSVEQEKNTVSLRFRDTPETKEMKVDELISYFNSLRDNYK
ncbi:probable threonine--tRNA ligase 1, cytoplasmic isoform X2 [Schistocerca gregaria]|nr:probable threonine--tRNA ligase 1, cytoplasmic isoform X2 [Schistocerca gregaria]XP_049850008.1 probable threonine--tRNA ligase 1, cytoplasmic isoform X2 [Schistocerca gregaria]